MRFKATHENLTIQVSPGELGECVRRVVRFLVPQHTRKVYLFAESKPSIPISDESIAVVGATDRPSNFLQSFRIILRPGGFIVVSGQARFTRDQWRILGENLEAYAA